MSRILVTGGTGVLGRPLVAQLAAQGHEVRVASRHAPDSVPAGAAWLPLDLIRADTLAPALAGVHTLVHAASSPQRNTHAIDVEGTRRLLAAAGAASVQHCIYVSIVGVDCIPFRYYQYKHAAEQLVKTSDLPWSIVRITQFHSFVDGMLRQLARLPRLMLLPAGFIAQPIDVGEAAERLVARVAAGPCGLELFGGPEVLPLPTMIRVWLHARHERRLMLPVPMPGATARAFRQGAHTCPAQRHGRITWAAWLQRTYSRAPEQA